MSMLPSNATAAERERLAFILNRPEHDAALQWLEAQEQLDAFEGELQTAVDSAYRRGLSEGLGEDVEAQLSALRSDVDKLCRLSEALRNDLRETADWLTSAPARLIAQRRQAAVALRTRAARPLPATCH
ncbi:MAG: hypothetical protein J0I00_04770 [Burkholderiales bacterium]|uniref:hypothetical protein n=1 Tax=Ottowia sp. TaxID=1898956 RepID=UPI001ACE4197|nr:hypothetical protein [Ottowia sp.]MBN9404715.1 hypothetical protein [Burkholderiales bacterium]MBS0403750.1 hypothetical protein [Pseudomonadota bacterium]MBS0415379.1 hypothetical protein [Pseudomonadota bacterium]HMN56320.1 hypothetical protein [Ottowia sp.]